MAVLTKEYENTIKVGIPKEILDKLRLSDITAAQDCSNEGMIIRCWSRSNETTEYLAPNLTAALDFAYYCWQAAVENASKKVFERMEAASKANVDLWRNDRCNWSFDE